MTVNYFEHSCYSENTIESMKINGKLYHMTGSFSLVEFPE